MTNKDYTISIRVRSTELQKVKDLGFNYSDVWQLGFERILENERAELVKLDEKYYKMYIRVHTKLENFGKKSDSEFAELDELMKWYLKQNRSIDDPTELDINALKFQMRKRDFHSFTVEQTLDYFKKNKPKPKKKKLSKEHKRKISVSVMKHNQKNKGAI